MDSQSNGLSDRTLELCDIPPGFTDINLVTLLKEYEKSFKFTRPSPDRAIIVFTSRTLCLRAKENLSKIGFFIVKLYEGDHSCIPYLPAQRPATSALIAGRIISRSIGEKLRPGIIRKHLEAHNRELDKIELADRLKKKAKDQEMRYWTNSYDR